MWVSFLFVLAAACFEPTLQANCSLCDATFSTLNHSINIVSCPISCWSQNSGVCGSGPYSGSICRAAMHAGKLSNSGGIVQVFKYGVSDAVGNLSYGINSTTCAATLSWSFHLTCNTTGDPQYGVTSLTCPPQCQSHKVCGSSPYSSDSSICAAAIHAGVINASGGSVRIIRRPGLASYTGSTGSGGVISENCSTSTTSFIFNTSLPTDECASHTCSNANCSQGINQFYCSCDVGYTGRNCTINIDDCTPNPCQNGTCTDLVNDYNCTCDFGYSGRNCSDYIGQCFAKPCQNGGNCTNGTSTSHDCACVPGWTGKNCSQDIDECAPKPCQNGGNCSNLLNAYNCSCPRGYSGTNCNITKNECESFPCQNGGTCMDLVLDYNCTCPPGYNGTNCEIAPSACFDVTCISNAVCDPSDKTCNCKPGYVGDGTTTCKLLCPQKVFEYLTNGKKYNFTFSPVALGVTSLSADNCPDGRSIASSACVQSSSTSTPSAVFDPPVVVLCDTPTSSVIQSIDVSNVTALDSKVVAKSLAQLTIVTSNAAQNTTISPKDAQSTIEILSAFGSTSASQVKITPNDLYNTLAVVSVVASSVANSGSSDTQTKQQQAQKLVSVLEEFTKRLVIPPGQPSVSLNTKDTAIQVKLPTKNALNQTQQIALEPSGNETSPVEAVVPGNIIDMAIANGTMPRVSFIVYLNNNLFPSTNPKEKSTTIVTVTVGDLNVTFPGNSGITFTHHVNRTYGEGAKDPNNPTKATYTDLWCGRWDLPQQAFVKTCLPDLQRNQQTCLCNDVGSYSLLFHTETLPSSFVQKIFTDVGLVLSCIGLVLTIIIYLAVPELRGRQPSIFLLHICFCLLVSNLLFLFGVANSHNPVPCYVTAVLLHYFLLATWCWMTSNGYNMYRALVQVLGARSNRAWKISAVFSYLTPAVIVGCTAGITLLHLDQINADKDGVFFESSYRARNMCWLQLLSLRYSFIIPVAILAIANVLFCSSILVHLTCKRSKIQSSAAERTTSHDMIVAATLIIMLGITWLFGFLMLIADHEVYLEVTAWLFCIFNVFQGLLIFILNCLRQPNVRSLWLHPIVRFLTCGKYYPLKTTPSSSSGGPFTSQTNPSAQKT